MKQLLPLLLLSVSCVSGSTMNDLIHQKYQVVYNPPVIQVPFENEEGEEVFEELQLLSIHTEPMTAPAFLEKLKNFEVDPLPAFADRDMQIYLIYHALKDYDERDEASGRFLSREIIAKCIENGPDPDFILKLMAEAINYNREELFDDLLDMFGALKMTQYTSFDSSAPISSAITQSGRFNYAKKLMVLGLSGEASPEHYARAACALGRNAGIVIDFLDFLIVKQEALDVNDLIYTFAMYLPATNSHSQWLPLLLILLKGHGSHGFKQAVGRWLVSIGADFTAVDEDGRSALVLAIKQAIDLY